MNIPILKSVFTSRRSLSPLWMTMRTTEGLSFLFKCLARTLTAKVLPAVSTPPNLGLPWALLTRRCYSRNLHHPCKCSMEGKKRVKWTSSTSALRDTLSRVTTAWNVTEVIWSTEEQRISCEIVDKNQYYKGRGIRVTCAHNALVMRLKWNHNMVYDKQENDWRN